MSGFNGSVMIFPTFCTTLPIVFVTLVIICPVVAAISPTTLPTPDIALPVASDIPTNQSGTRGGAIPVPGLEKTLPISRLCLGCM